MNKTVWFILCLVLCADASVYAAEKPLDADHAYNQGVDFYAKPDYNKSADSFLQSMNTQDKRLEQWSAYNLGSAYFGQGQDAEKKNPSAANQIYQKALSFFKRAIELNPQDKDAKYNYELTTKKIIEQKQKEKQQQNKKDKQDKKDQQNKQNQQEKQNNQDKKDKQGQQNKQDQQQKQNEQEQKEKAGQKKEQGESQQSAQQNQQRRQMTPEEAKMLLKNFQQSEEKKKEMKLQKAQQQSAPGVKGW